MTTQDIQTLIDNTPVNGTCVFPGGLVDVLENTPINVSKAITIEGNNTIIRVVNSLGEVSTLMPTLPLFNFAAVPDWSDVTVRNLKVQGPDASSWSVTLAPNTAVLDWTKSGTWNASFTIDNCHITGGYCYAVQRAGGGDFKIFNSYLSGFVGSFSFFESHGGSGNHICRDTILEAPANHKYTSIGAYIHPHLHVTWERVHAIGWNRYALYLNGTPQSQGHHDLVDVIAEDCSLIQTGSSSETTLLRCKELGVPANGGSFFKGPVLSVGSEWRSKGIIGLFTNTSKRRFINDTIAPQSIFIAAGNNTFGTIEMIDCDIELYGNNCAFRINSGSGVQGRIINSRFTGSTTGWAINLEGGSCELINTLRPTKTRVIGAATLQEN